MKSFSIIAVSLALFGSLSLPALAKKNTGNAYRLVEGKSSKSASKSSKFVAETAILSPSFASKSSKSASVSAKAGKALARVTLSPSLSPTDWAQGSEFTTSPTPTLVTLSPTDASSSTNTAGSPSFSILNAHTNKYLTIKDGCYDGSGIELVEYGVFGQLWKNNGPRIESVDCPGFLLDILGDDGESDICAQGTALVIAGVGDRKSQYWSFLDAQAGVIESFRCPGFVIDIMGYGETNGSHIYIWPVHGEWNQIWTITESSNTTSLSTRLTASSLLDSHLLVEEENDECGDEEIVHCLVDPCHYVDCGEHEVCVASFCGGCFGSCEPASFSY